MNRSVFSKSAAVLICSMYLAAAAAFSASTDAGLPETIPQEPVTASQTTAAGRAPVTERAAETECATAGDRKMVALTFDDGPSVPHTDKILDLLTINGAKATFFVVGQRVSEYEQVLRREQELGCQIGNHTFDHKTLTALTAENIRAQTEKTDTAVQSLLGVAPQILRALQRQERDRVMAELKADGVDYEERIEQIQDVVRAIILSYGRIDGTDWPIIKNRIKRDNLTIEDYPEWIGGWAWAFWYLKVGLLTIGTIYVAYRFVSPLFNL